jgi:chemotaxis protein MotA
MILAVLMTVYFYLPMAFIYLDLASFILVIGGSLGSLLWAMPLDRAITGFKSIGKTFKPPSLDARGAIDNIIKLSNLARRESLLALEEPVRDMNDPFLQKGIMLVVDGADPELVRNVLETEIAYIENRLTGVRGMWDQWASSAPSWGMMATFIALINMLNALDDMNLLGPNMAFAIITTLYGSIVANVFCIPISTKLKNYSNDELLVKEVQIEGILSI